MSSPLKNLSCNSEKIEYILQNTVIHIQTAHSCARFVGLQKIGIDQKIAQGLCFSFYGIILNFWTSALCLIPSKVYFCKIRRKK